MSALYPVPDFYSTVISRCDELQWVRRVEDKRVDRLSVPFSICRRKSGKTFKIWSGRRVDENGSVGSGEVEPVVSRMLVSQ